MVVWELTMIALFGFLAGLLAAHGFSHFVSDVVSAVVVAGIFYLGLRELKRRDALPFDW